MATKKNKRRKINWNEINEKIDTGGGKKNYKEDNGYSEFEFKPHLEDGTHDSIIRFLPRPEGDVDQIPYVKLFNHGFKTATGQWFIENCPTTIGGECPVCTENSAVWKTGEEGKQLARSRARKQSFYTNILVINDPQTPENNGKVFIFRFGIKVMKKIMAKLSPESEIDERVDVFDFDKGMNFKLKIRTGEYRNYDSCEFAATPTSLGDDDFINKIDSQLHTLDPIIATDKFKNFDTLKNSFDKKSGKATVNVPLYGEENSLDNQAPSNASADDEVETIFDGLRND